MAASLRSTVGGFTGWRLHLEFRPITRTVLPAVAGAVNDEVHDQVSLHAALPKIRVASPITSFPFDPFLAAAGVTEVRERPHQLDLVPQRDPSAGELTRPGHRQPVQIEDAELVALVIDQDEADFPPRDRLDRVTERQDVDGEQRSEEHTSELQSQ